MSTLHIQLLGEFQVTYADAPVSGLHHGPQRALFAYLLLHRHAPQSRQHLAFLLWPESTEPQAYRNLRKNLHLLRQVLPNAAQYLQSDAKTVQWRLDAPFVLDVAAFEQKLAASHAHSTPDQVNRQVYLAEAVQLYKGDLLPECYDDWILSERERLRESYLDALLRLIDLLEETRAYELAIRYAQQALRHDPLREDVYLQLMRLHLLNSDRAGALRVYHTCASILQAELGVEPNAQTRALYENLLHGATGSFTGAALPPPPVTRHVLIGRHNEWQQLLTTWHRATGGHLRPTTGARVTQAGPHFVLLVGEAGLGKTRLAEELTSWVRHQGMRTAQTRAYAAEGALAYNPVTEWLRSEALCSAWRTLDTAWLTELARLLPELSVEQPHLPPPRPLTERWQRQRLFEALARAVLASKQPLLLVLDDLQWCDQETLEWLHYLLRYDAQARLLIVGTMRPEEVDTAHPFATLLFELRRTGQITEITLEPLDRAETVALATQVAGQQLTLDAAQGLYRDTEGNPLFVVETIRMALSRQGEASIGAGLSFVLPSLPTKVQAIIQQRLVHLSSTAHALAQLAAVIGRSFTFTLLAQASDLTEDVLVRSLDELWQRRIVREQGVAAYDFCHDYIREIAYTESPPAHRQLLHRRIAQTLAKLYASDLDGICSQLAVHYERSGELEQALTYYQRAATVAQQRFAYTERLAYLNKMLTLLEGLPKTPLQQEQQVETLLRLGNTLTMVKGFTAVEVEASYNRARTLCQSVAKPEKRLWVFDSLRRYWGQRCRWLVATALSEEMLQLAQQLHDSFHYQNALRFRGAELFHQGNFPAALDHFAQACTLAQAPQGPMHATNYMYDLEVANLARFAATLWFVGYPTQAETWMNEMLAKARKVARPLDLLFALEFSIELAHYWRKPATMQGFAEEMTGLITRYPLGSHMMAEMLYRGYRLTAQGAREAGLCLLKQAVETLHKEGTLLYLPYRYSLLVEMYQQTHQIEAGLTLVEDTLALAQATGEQFWSAELQRLKGELLLAQGMADEKGEVCFQQAIALAQQQGAKMLELRATVSLARLWQTQGKRAEAQCSLMAIYRWFTEGFETLDLQEAKALLLTLA